VRSPAAATITLLADITAATTTAADHFLNGWPRLHPLDKLLSRQVRSKINIF